MLVRLENRLGRIRVQDRKQDTRNKIQLGGLVIRAGLGEEDSAVLLGALLSAAQAIQAEGEMARRRYRRIGDSAFTAAGEGETRRS